VSRGAAPAAFGGRFLWAVGIEDTAIGLPVRQGRTLDEYELTGHDRQWREDLDRVADLGARGLRYGISWYRVNPAPGVYDWDWLDEVVTHARHRGIELIADLVHYGTPRWLPDAFADPEYPKAIGEFAGAVAERYVGAIRHFTPLNEPLITASFCGQRGIWPPFLTGDTGWLRVILHVSAGIQTATQAIRAAQPDATILHVEAAHLCRSDDPVLAAEVQLASHRAFLATDLVLGQVDEAHPLYGWVLRHGGTEAELAELRANAIVPDVIGVNYYPELSPRELVVHDGQIGAVAYDAWADGLAAVLAEWADRYPGIELLLAETGVDGDDAHRAHWLRDSIERISLLRAEGLPIVGYTWWPLFDFVDWAYASVGEVVEEFLIRLPAPDGGTALSVTNPPGRPGDPPPAYLRRMGLWRLDADDAGELARVQTGAADTYRLLIRAHHDQDRKDHTP
jgi:beta-glucosidase/6-phospho-beta-glucosidase/beta-galactosidase